MSETKYEPGTVAVATVRGVKGVRVMRTTTDIWRHVFTDGHFYSRDAQVTDVRPLVVLDLDTITTPEENCGIPASTEVVKCLNKAGESAGGWRGTVAMRIADQIEAQTKPARIPEPVAFDAAVEAHTHQPLTGSTRRRFVRVHDRDGGYSWVDRTGEHRPWAELLDPALIREGVSA